MARRPLMSGWCGAPNETDGVSSHTKCKGYNTANPGKEWQPCPCLCHMGEEYQCGNCGRPIMEAPLWRPLEEEEDTIYVHVTDGRGVGEDCPPGGKPPVVEDVEPESIDVEIDTPTKPKKKKKKGKKKKDKKKKDK